jgi:hypothetical protein
MCATPSADAIARTQQDAKTASDSSAVLAPLMNYVQLGRLPHVVVSTKDNRETDIALPASVLRLLLNALQEMGKGNAVPLLPLEAELITQ